LVRHIEQEVAYWPDIMGSNHRPQKVNCSLKNKTEIASKESAIKEMPVTMRSITNVDPGPVSSRVELALCHPVDTVTFYSGLNKNSASHFLI